jgi:uncharacterized protein (DUF4415 family)
LIKSKEEKAKETTENTKTLKIRVDVIISHDVLSGFKKF